MICNSCSKNYKSKQSAFLDINISVAGECYLGDTLIPKVLIKNTSINSQAGSFEIMIKVNDDEFQKAQFKTGPLPGNSDELIRPSGWKAKKIGKNIFEGFILDDNGVIIARCQEIVIVK